MSSVFNPFCCLAAPAQRSLPSWSIMKWFLPWSFQSRFLELARLPGTAAVSSSICIYSSFLFVLLLLVSRLLTVIQPPPSSIAWDVVGTRNHSVGNCKFPIIICGSEALCTVKWKSHRPVTVAIALEAAADHCIPSNRPMCFARYSALSAITYNIT